ncbi:MAG: cobalamin-dependent protein [Deltaproteobacteria bacterium]|nr:cobalamin-dependent protein [Deltaproteobacteria bacterium]
MRVLLVQAFTAQDMELVYPLGLASLAAHLDGHEVRIFDLNLHPEGPLEALDRALRGWRPEVVGVSLRNIKVARPGEHRDDFGPQREVVARVRQAAPGAVLLAGGAAFSLYAEVFMRRLPEIDLGLWGEGEERLPELLARLDRPWEVRGIYWRDGQQVRYSGDPAEVNFAALRRPRRDLVPLAPYAAHALTSVGVQSKRGCALHCIHCSDTFLLGTRVRQRAPARVVDEIQELVEDYGVRRFFFADTIFNLPPRHALEIARELIDRRLDVEWAAWFNEHRQTLPDELIAAVREAGCGLLSFSPDHVEDRMLARLDKNFRRADLDYTTTLGRRHGIDVEYSFFLNSPGETPATLLAILRFLAQAKRELGPHLRAFTLLMMQPIRLYPHTRIAELAREEGLIDRDDDLIEARFWNPGPLSLVVAGVQRGASLAWRVRQASRSAGR